MNNPFDKISGGPGSGKSRDSTDTIEALEKSPLITIHKRKEITSHRGPDRETDVSLDQIDYGAQTTYDIENLGWMLGHFEEWKNDPIQVARVDGDYHLMDGHHRFLAAKRLGEDTIPAKVWVMDEGEVQRVTGQKEAATGSDMTIDKNNSGFVHRRWTNSDSAAVGEDKHKARATEGFKREYGTSPKRVDYSSYHGHGSSTASRTDPIGEVPEDQQRRAISDYKSDVYADRGIPAGLALGGLAGGMAPVGNTRTRAATTFLGALSGAALGPTVGRSVAPSPEDVDAQEYVKNHGVGKSASADSQLGTSKESRGKVTFEQGDKIYSTTNEKMVTIEEVRPDELTVSSDEAQWKEKRDVARFKIREGDWKPGGKKEAMIGKLAGPAQAAGALNIADPDKDTSDTLKGVGAATLTSGAAGLGSAGIGSQLGKSMKADQASRQIENPVTEQALVNQVMDDAPDDLDFKSGDEIAADRSEKIDDPVDRKIRKEKLKSIIPDKAGYNPLFDTVMNAGTEEGISNQSPEVVAHEIGHADLHRSLPTGGSTVSMLGRFGAPAAIPAGMYGYFQNKKENPEKARNIRDGSLAIGAGGASMTLADEAGASYFGGQRVEDAADKLDISGDELDMAGRKASLGKAFGTYGAATLLPLAAAGGVYAADANNVGPFDDTADLGGDKEASASKEGANTAARFADFLEQVTPNMRIDGGGKGIGMDTPQGKAYSNAYPGDSTYGRSGEATNNKLYGTDNAGENGPVIDPDSGSISSAQGAAEETAEGGNSQGILSDMSDQTQKQIGYGAAGIGGLGALGYAASQPSDDNDNVSRVGSLYDTVTSMGKESSMGKQGNMVKAAAPSPIADVVQQVTRRFDNPSPTQTKDPSTVVEDVKQTFGDVPSGQSDTKDPSAVVEDVRSTFDSPTDPMDRLMERRHYTPDAPSPSQAASDVKSRFNVGEGENALVPSTRGGALAPTSRSGGELANTPDRGTLAPVSDEAGALMRTSQDTSSGDPFGGPINLEMDLDPSDFAAGSRSGPVEDTSSGLGYLDNALQVGGIGGAGYLINENQDLQSKIDSLKSDNREQEKEGSQDKTAVPGTAAGALIGGAGGAGINYLGQRADMRDNPENNTLNPYGSARSALIGAGVGATGPLLFRQTDELIGKADDTISRAEGVMGDVEDTRQAVTESAEEVSETAQQAQNTMSEVEDTSQAVRQTAEKARDNRFMGIFQGSPDDPAETAAEGAEETGGSSTSTLKSMFGFGDAKEGSKKAVSETVGDAIVDYARRTDGGSTDEFQNFLSENTELANPDVRLRPTREGMPMNNVKFSGGGNGPEMYEVQGRGESYIVPGVDADGENLTYPDALSGAIDGDGTVDNLKSVEPISKREVESTGPVETEFRIPVGDRRVNSDEDYSDVANGLVAGGILGGSGYVANRSQQDKDIIPKTVKSSLGMGSGGDSSPTKPGDTQNKNAANRGTIVVEAENLSQMDPGFDMDFGIQGQETDFDFSMPNEVNADMPSVDEPSAGRTTAGRGPDPNEVDIPTPDSPDQSVDKPKQMVD